jgi:hypothetical protein
MPTASLADVDPFSHVGEMLQKSRSRPKASDPSAAGVLPRDSDPELAFSFDEQPDLGSIL